MTDNAPVAMPPLRDDISIQEAPRELDGSPCWTIYDPVRNQFFKINETELALLESWHLQEAGKIIEAVNKKMSHRAPVGFSRVGEKQLEQFGKFLLSTQLIRVTGEEHRRYFTRLDKNKQSGILNRVVKNYLFFKIPLVKPNDFLDRTWPLVRPLFTSRFLKIMAVLLILGFYLVLREWDDFITTYEYFFTVEGIIVFGITLAVVKILHELGHAYACKYYGLKVPTMGIAFLVMWPVLYTDATDAWRLTSRWSRARIAAAGISVELCLATIAMLLWPFLPEGMFRSAAFFVATTAWIMSLFVNLNPLMRFDGYYFLSDVLNVPNLQDRSFAAAKIWIRNRLFNAGLDDGESWSPQLRRTIIIYAMAVWVYRFFLFLGIALLVYYMFFKALGILLFIVEIWWFILRPIYNEVVAWKEVWPVADVKYKKRIYWALGVFLFVCFAPWRFSIHVPATLQVGEYQVFYPDFPSRVAEVRVEDGLAVKKGDVLLVLDSPDLAFQVSKVQKDVQIYQGELDRQSTSESGVAQLLTLQQELAKAYAELQTFSDQQEKLTITAPFDGTIREVTTGLQKGLWVGEGVPLFVLVNHTVDGEVDAYIPEAYLDDVRPDGTAWFYPENLDLPVVEVNVVNVEGTDTGVLERPYLSSIFNGGIPSAKSKDNEIVVEESVYRLRGAVKLDEDLGRQVVRGELKVPTGPVSYGMQFIKKVAQVLIRESGF